MRLRLFDDEMVGVDRLRLMASELYGEVDPHFRLRGPLSVHDFRGPEFSHHGASDSLCGQVRP